MSNEGYDQVSQSSRTMADQPEAAGGAVSQGAPTHAEGAHAGGGDGHNIKELVGKTIDRYKIEKLLGEGGFGAVYKATHTLLQKPVAFKTLHKEHAQNPEILRRFLREGQVSGRFRHKHAIEIYDFGPLGDGSYFMAMEFLPGKDLRDILKKKGALELAPAFDVMIMTLQALGAAHEGGVIHRDLKPDNIKLEKREEREDFVKLFDFGIAKLVNVHEKMDEPTGKMTAEEAQKIAEGIDRKAKQVTPDDGYKTQVGAFFGTPEYGSPEQCAGDEIDFRSDIYTMGVILYELLSGSLPFVSKTPQGYLAQHMVATPRPLTEVKPDLKIPKDVEAIIMKAMEKEKEKRFQNCKEFAEALIACAKKNKIPITVESFAEATPLWKILVPVALALAIMGGGFWWYLGTLIDPRIKQAQDEIASYQPEFNYEAQLKVLAEIPKDVLEKPKNKAWFDETENGIKAKIKSRDDAITAEVSKVEEKIKVEKFPEGEYDPKIEACKEKIDELQSSIGAKVNGHSPHLSDLTAERKKVEGMRDAVIAQREADAAKDWETREKQINGLMDGFDFGGARDLALAFPAKFKTTSTQAKVQAKLQDIETADKNTKPADREAKNQLDLLRGYVKENPEDWKGIDDKCNTLIAKYKGTRAENGARLIQTEAHDRHEQVAEKLFNEQIKAKVDPLLASGKPVDINNALDITDTFPAIHENTAAKGLNDTLVQTIINAGKAGWMAAKTHANALHEKGDVKGAIAAIIDWKSLSPRVPLVSSMLAPKQLESYNKMLQVQLYEDKDGKMQDEMIPIPAADVTVGERITGPASPPQNPQHVGKFAMMKFEVTNAQYEIWLNDSNAAQNRYPPDWVAGKDGKLHPPAGEEKHPARFVTWKDADDFAHWCGLRLPTEVEWEYAARGADPFKDIRLPNGQIDPNPAKYAQDFPWGSNPTAQNIGNIGKDTSADDDIRTSAVGLYQPGDSPFNISDMAGNVAEWTASDYLRYNNPRCPEDDPDYGQLHKVVKGGSFMAHGNARACRAAYREPVAPDARRPDIGFRCVKSLD